MAIHRFKGIGLDINTSKSVCINITKGQLTSSHLELDEGEIKMLSPGEYIRYLGVDFENVISFNPQKIIQDLRHKLEILSSSPLLQADQKFCILNTSICPTLIYTSRLFLNI